MAREQRHQTHPRPSLPPDDAGQDRAISPFDEKSDPAGKLLSARTARTEHRGIRRVLQRLQIPREPGEPNAGLAGISIGSIKAALIAGNAPEHRVQRLRTCWEEITAPTSLWHSALDGQIVEWQQWTGALTALMFGQPGFFEPREPHDWLLSNRSVSYYKTSALKSTLER